VPANTSHGSSSGGGSGAGSGSSGGGQAEDDEGATTVLHHSMCPGGREEQEFKNGSWPNLSAGLSVRINYSEGNSGNESSDNSGNCVGGSTAMVQPAVAGRSMLHMDIGSVLQSGFNTMTINTPQCCCMHAFAVAVVQMVDSRSVRAACLLRSVDMQTSATHVKTKLAPTHGKVNVSLKCPITRERIVVPVRGRDCQHFECFDLDAYLSKGSGDGLWCCPLCKQDCSTSSLVKDEFFATLLTHSTAASNIVNLDDFW
jgi:hypothetical protein